VNGRVRHLDRVVSLIVGLVPASVRGMQEHLQTIERCGGSPQSRLARAAEKTWRICEAVMPLRTTTTMAATGRPSSETTRDRGLGGGIVRLKASMSEAGQGARRKTVRAGGAGGQATR